MKKQYQTPQATVINIHSSDIICTSNINTGKKVETVNNDYIGVGGPWEGEID